jgi:hypothetical protein
MLLGVVKELGLVFSTGAGNQDVSLGSPPLLEPSDCRVWESLSDIHDVKMGPDGPRDDFQPLENEIPCMLRLLPVSDSYNSFSAYLLCLIVNRDHLSLTFEVVLYLYTVFK